MTRPLGTGRSQICGSISSLYVLVKWGGPQRDRPFRSGVADQLPSDGLALIRGHDIAHRNRRGRRRGSLGLPDAGFRTTFTGPGSGSKRLLCHALGSHITPSGHATALTVEPRTTRLRALSKAPSWYVHLGLGPLHIVAAPSWFGLCQSIHAFALRHTLHQSALRHPVQLVAHKRALIHFSRGSIRCH